jgi:hypothetical protein
MYLGDFATGKTIHCLFTTNAADGSAVAPSTGFESADVILYKDGSATQRTSQAGWTMTSPFDAITGLHLLSIDTSDNTDAGFYASGHDYTLVLSPDTETVDGKTVVAVIGRFSIENRSPLRPATAGRTLNVSAGGAGDANAVQQNGTNLPSVSGTTGLPPVDVQGINDVAADADAIAGNVSTLASRLTAGRATGLDHLDADVSSRAAASAYTAGRAALIDHLDADVSSRATNAGAAAQVTTDHGAGSYVDSGLNANVANWGGSAVPALSPVTGLVPVDIQAINDDAAPANTLAADIADIGADVDIIEGFGAPPSAATIAGQVTTDHGAGSYVDSGAPPSAAAIAAQITTDHGVGSYVDTGVSGTDVNVISWGGDAVPALSPVSGLVPVDVQAVNDNVTSADDLAGVPTAVSNIGTDVDNIQIGVDQANDVLAAIEPLISRILGLNGDNWVLDGLTYDADENLETATAYVYDTRAHAITNDHVTGLTAKYDLQNTVVAGLLTLSKQLRNV